MIQPFPVYQRMRYLNVDTTSKVGVRSTVLKMFVSFYYALKPNHTIHIYPPEGMLFSDVVGRKCVPDRYPGDTESRKALIPLFPKPELSEVIPIPDWMDCRIRSRTEVVVTNMQDTLGGRSLAPNLVYEFFIENVTNPKRTPPLN